MDWKFEKICIQYLTQGWNVKFDEEDATDEVEDDLNITRLECKEYQYSR